MVLRDVRFELFVAPTVCIHAVHLLDELIRAVTALTGLAVDQRVVEAADVAGSHPDLAVHQDRAVHAHVVLALLYELLPPGTLDVVFELHAQRAIVPGVCQAAINFGACENESAPFAQSDQFVHRRCCHDCFSSLRYKKTDPSFPNEIGTKGHCFRGSTQFDGEPLRPP